MQVFWVWDFSLGFGLRAEIYGLKHLAELRAGDCARAYRKVIWSRPAPRLGRPVEILKALPKGRSAIPQIRRDTIHDIVHYLFLFRVQLLHKERRCAAPVSR